MRIVCIGDSISAGQHVPFGRAWPYLLRDNGYDIIPAGISGDTTRLALERFPQYVQNDPPDIVVIQFGHNDCNRWETDRGLPRVSDRAFMANLEEMIDRCRAFDARPYLCTLTPSLRSGQHSIDVAKYDRIIREVAETSDVPLIDVRTEFMGSYGLLMDDGLHLTEAGHEMYAAVVARALSE